MSTRDKTFIYAIITSLDGEDAYEYFRDSKKALRKAREKAKSLAKERMMIDTLLPRVNPDCLLQILWDDCNDDNISVMRVPLN
jgi:Ser/Thr protein kinase RdoA (MazF antagonist)